MASTEGASGTGGAEGVTSFGDRLADRVAARESQLVLGLDPDPTRLWPDALRAAERNDSIGVSPAPGRTVDVAPASDHTVDTPAADHTVDPAPAADHTVDPTPAADHTVDLAAAADHTVDPTPAARAARAVAAHCAMVIDAVGEYCVAVKLQVACFERLGAPGWAALAETAALVRERGLLLIADAKRGDVAVTAVAYAQCFLGETPTPFGPVAGLRADAMTVNPLLGADSLEPFVTTARAHARGLFVLVRTSNPGAADIQERGLADGRSVSERLADLVDEVGADGLGRSGLSDVGAVVGATAPGRLARLRERMPRAVFLLPGVGAQGGQVEDLAPAFAAGPASGLISVSRGIVAAHERAGGDHATAASRAAGRLRELAWRLTA